MPAPMAASSMGLLRASLIVASAFTLAQCGRSPPRPNVLIVSIDTLRADHLGCYGYAPYAQPVSPHLDELAKSGLVFERCTTARGQTAPSLGSLMTGLFPSHHGVIDNFFSFRPGTRSLAQELMAAGYDAYAFASYVPGSRDGKATLGIPADHVEIERAIHPDWAMSRLDDEAEHRFTEFVRRRDGAARPFFTWVHFYDVHQPYTPPPPFDTIFTGDYRGPLRLPQEIASQEERERYFTQRIERVMDERMLARAPIDRDDAKYLVGLYDGGVRETDERIGRMLDALQQAGLRDDTLVIVTADHGEELGQHNSFWFHGNSVHQPVLHIPLIVSGPGVRSGRTDALVQNVDVMPTLLDFLGAPPPVATDGVSFAPTLRAGGPAAFAPRAIAWSEWQDLILGAQTTRHHLIFNPRGAHPKKPPYFGVPTDGGYFVDCAELYDLQKDPLETRDLWDEQKDAVADLRAEVADEYARRGFGGADATRFQREPTDPEPIKQIHETGYEAPSEVTDERKDVVLDPESCRNR